MPSSGSFADNLRHYRVQSGLTQEDLALKTEMDHTQISHYERGARKPSMESLAKLANALRVSIDKLMFSK